MKPLIALAASALIFASCSDDIITVDPVTEAPVEAPALENPDEYHQKVRTEPYPRSCNDIYINPAPLLVPKSKAAGPLVQAQLSSSPDFSADNTTTFEPRRWYMFNIHRTLEAGRWYWRYRSVDEAGNPGEWSETLDFEISADVPQFVTPDASAFMANLPLKFPRIHCYTNATVDRARAEIESSPEYSNLIARANNALKVDFSNITPLYSSAESLNASVRWLYQAYYLTQRREYADHLLLLVKSFVAAPPSDRVLYSDNFTTSNITAALAECYDILYYQLDANTCRTLESFFGKVLARVYEGFIGVEENHIFDNHFWQQNFRNYLQTAICIYDKPEQSAIAREMLEYLYELWTSRAPAGGFNRDGLWHNGAGYFNANIETLAYVPLLFSYITGCDFLQHPWYRNAGRALSFSTPPGGTNIGFGDGSEKRTEPNHQMAGFADFLAYQTGDTYASWYAGQCGRVLYNDYDLRIYRICRGRQDFSADPAGMENSLAWYQDCGEVAMHSSLTDRSSDLALGFRSSTFGSGSHTTACQNAFNLSFGGHDVFRSSGYYQNFSDAHNLMSYRHTRAHNTILVDGIGQPYSTAGWGRVLRAAGGASIAYALGDASNAYCGVSDDPMWVKAFETAGITQTPDNGFGVTPLSKYFRHVVMLQPGFIVIYDELEATRAAKWEWLLHSAKEFSISPDNSTAEIIDRSAGFKARLTLLSRPAFDFSKTDEWRIPPAQQGPEYPAQWHLTATVSSAPSVRFLAIIQTSHPDDDFTTVTSNNDSFSLHGWEIKAELDPSKPASLQISSSSRHAALFYGDGPLVLDGTSYPRTYLGSTLVADRIDGEFRCIELNDHRPGNSRNN